MSLNYVEYNRKNWVDEVVTGTAITSSDMNRIENGIYNIREELKPELYVLAGVPLEDQNPARNHNGIYAMKYGRLVTMYVRGGSVWGPVVKDSSPVQLCTLPEQIRPIVTVGCAWVTPGTAVYGVLYAEHEGRVLIAKSEGEPTSYYQCCVSWLVE